MQSVGHEHSCTTGALSVSLWCSSGVACCPVLVHVLGGSCFPVLSWGGAPPWGRCFLYDACQFLRQTEGRLVYVWGCWRQLEILWVESPHFGVGRSDLTSAALAIFRSCWRILPAWSGFLWRIRWRFSRRCGVRLRLVGRLGQLAVF